ncbi:hypothetical protein ABW19_dt0207578 [Dactylella cylindrospora]|nr:hypothetical protein ABW19_dt0207578 [Dactylella cylindrospora]
MILRFNKRLLSTTIATVILIFFGLNYLFYHVTFSQSLYTYLGPQGGSRLQTGSTEDVIARPSHSSVGAVVGGGGSKSGKAEEGQKGLVKVGGEKELDNASDWCSRVAGQRYLEDAASTWTVSCLPPENRDAEVYKSSMICFQAQVEELPDNFCVARNAVYNPVPQHRNRLRRDDTGLDTRENIPSHLHNRRDFDIPLDPLAVNRPWSLSCSRKTEWSYGVQAMDAFRIYFSDTGVGVQLRGFQLNSDLSPPKNWECKDSVMLVKLEGGGNIWHTLMEVWAAFLTLDILKKATEAKEKLGFEGTEGGVWDDGKVKVVVQQNLDSEKHDSPIFDLWNVVTGQPPINVADLEPGCYKSVIMPLAGGGNPFWKDHWHQRRCEKSSLVDDFVEKVLKFYGVDTSTAELNSPTEEGKIRVRIIARNHNRKILKLYDYVKTLKKEYPDTAVDITSLENMSIKQQLELVRQTDVLIGVTGAGLTHTMFLKEGSAVIELMHPEPFNYFGFGNLARMRSLDYYPVHGERRGEGKEGDWQQDNVLVDEKIFMENVGKAIEEQHKRREKEMR